MLLRLRSTENMYFLFPNIIQIVKQVSPYYSIISITSDSESGLSNELVLQQQESILCFKRDSYLWYKVH